MLERWNGLSTRAMWLWIALATAFVEGVTLILRFGFGLKAQVESSWVAPLTFGFRIHHGYIGVALLLAALLVKSNKGLRNVLVICGAALVFSDMIHHFIVLWAVAGSHEFYLRYE